MKLGFASYFPRFLLCGFFIFVPLCHSSAVVVDNFVTDYLRKYGYIAGASQRSAGQMTVETAIRSFQSFAGLAETGSLDNATLSKMKEMRCGVKDIPSIAVGRRKRQIMDFGKWPQNQLTYRVMGRPARLPPQVTDDELRRAFGMWSKVANVTLIQVPDEFPANMEIAFVKGDHGDHEPFDGPKGMLGHAFFPPFGGNTHFDDSENWTSETTDGVNLFQVATHEFGHALGLGHSRNPRALMAPFYQPFSRNFSLQKEDIRQIQKLYGQRMTFESNELPGENPFQPLEASTTIASTGDEMERADEAPSNSSLELDDSTTTTAPENVVPASTDNQTTAAFQPQTRFFTGGGNGFFGPTIPNYSFGNNFGFTPPYGNNYGGNFGGFGNGYGNGFGFGNNYGNNYNGYGNSYGNNYGSTYGPANYGSTYQTPYYPNGQVPLYPVYPNYYYTTTTTAAPTTTTSAPPTYYYPPYNPYTPYTSFPSYAPAYPSYPAFPSYPSYPGPYAPGYGGGFGGGFPTVIVGTPTTTTTAAPTTTPAPIFIFVNRPSSYGNNNGYGNGLGYGGGGGGNNYGFGGNNGFGGYRQGGSGAGTFATFPAQLGQSYGGFGPGPIILRGSTTLAVSLPPAGAAAEDPNGDSTVTRPSVNQIAQTADDSLARPKIEPAPNRLAAGADVTGPLDGSAPAVVNSRADLCAVETPDAVVATGSGSFMVFKGPTFWTLDKGFNADEPRKINILSPLLTQVDAAYLKPPHVFLFSGTDYHKFLVKGNEINRLPDYPKLISQGYPGMLNRPLDEVIRRGSQLWFFRGPNVTVYNPEKFPPIDAASGFLDIKILEGFPDKVVAAIVDETDPKGSFVFSSGIAYRLSQSGDKLRSRSRHFPKTFREWLRCESVKRAL